MARFWTERFDSSRHKEKMWGALPLEAHAGFDRRSEDPLVVRSVYFVNVCQFTFEFLTLAQLRVCVEYFEQELPGPDRLTEGIGGADHWEVQRWYERLPRGLRQESKRVRIARALRRALLSFVEAGGPPRP